VRATLLCLLLLAGCAPRPPDFTRRTGTIQLPPGRLVLHRELVIPEGAHDLEVRGHPSGSTLAAASDFQGRALICSQGATRLRLTGFRIEGNRAALQKLIGLPATDTPFARFYQDNGILIEAASGVTVSKLVFHEVANYPLIVSASADVTITGVRVEDSGSLSPTLRNNASGGILLEEGTRDFEVTQCVIRRVRGNGIWTHAFHHSPRNSNGVIHGNNIENVARDAIQVGHATHVNVTGNTGRWVGYPPDIVDIANWAVPAAIDTAGNVDKSTYSDNHFEDIDGKCMDLDGFHDGEIRDNSCVSHGPYDAYPWAQFGIVFNNANPDMESANVAVIGNLIDGAGYGGLYLLGSHHLISHNRFIGLNRNQCTGDRSRPRCDYGSGDPALLQSGVYLVPGAARPARTVHNRIEDNEVSGFGMRRGCIVAASGVSLAANQAARNRCLDLPDDAALTQSSRRHRQ
jgi:hypothetical protein